MNTSVDLVLSPEFHYFSYPLLSNLKSTRALITLNPAENPIFRAVRTMPATTDDLILFSEYIFGHIIKY